MKKRARTSRALTKKIKSVVLRTCERKWTGVWTTAPAQVLSAMIVTAISAIPEHSAFSQSEHSYRSGQDYYLTGCRLKYLIANNAISGGTYQPLFYRTIVIESSMLLATAAPIQTTLMFLDTNGTNVSWAASLANTSRALFFKVDPKWYKVIYDKIFRVGPDGGNGIGSVYKTIWIPINKKIVTNERNEGPLQQNKCYYVLNLPYIVRGAANDTIDVQFEWKTYFRDP